MRKQKRRRMTENQEIKGTGRQTQKQLEEAYGRLIDDATISCQAF